MKLYTVLIDDRYTDPQILLFSTYEKAMTAIKDYLSDFEESIKQVDPLDVTMSEDLLIKHNLLFYVCYSTEGNNIRMRKVKVDAV